MRDQSSSPGSPKVAVAGESASLRYDKNPMRTGVGAPSPSFPPAAPAAEIYKSVRQEILDQKKCQFHMFGAAITLTAGILAYTGSQTARANPIVYVAPIILNTLALTIILDKALSIQRMVGYLQLMESENNGRRWMWEFHLNKFRERSPKPVSADKAYRKHTYIRNISLMLVILDFAFTALALWGPEGILLSEPTEYARIYGALTLAIGLLDVVAVYVAFRRWRELTAGCFTSEAIAGRWREVLSESP
jgi:hypothetical protein